MNDVLIMRRCLELAAQGRGLVGNGALVGAVLVRDGNIIAEAFHEGFGRPHAERKLLEEYKGEILPTDTLYVNLEPCCHHGKTPPCTDILIERGVRNVVYGMKDPDTRVSGSGLEKLRAALASAKLGGDGSCDIRGPVLPAECAWLNRGFVTVRTKKRPWITLKKAVTADGQISSSTGAPLKITSVRQDEWSHRFLRLKHDAILVGAGTIAKDDPLLTTRFVQISAHSYRLILDPMLRTSSDANVFDDQETHPTIVITSSGADISKRAEILKRGAKVFDVSLAGDIFLFPELFAVLTTPKDDFHGITSMLVEGGARTWKNFKRAGYVDAEVTLRG